MVGELSPEDLWQMVAGIAKHVDDVAVSARDQKTAKQ